MVPQPAVQIPKEEEEQQEIQIILQLLELVPVRTSFLQVLVQVLRKASQRLALQIEKAQEPRISQWKVREQVTRIRCFQSPLLLKRFQKSINENGRKYDFKKCDGQYTKRVTLTCCRAETSKSCRRSWCRGTK